MHPSWRLAILAGIPLVVLTLGNSSRAAGSPRDTSPAAPNAGSAGAIQAHIKTYLHPPVFKAPGPAIRNLAKARTKSVFTIPFSSANPFCQAMDTGVRQAAKDAGIRNTEFTNQGTSAEWVRGINTAIANKAAALNLTCGVGPAQVAPQIAQAKQRGIPTVIGYAYDPSQSQPANIAANVVGLFALPGTLMADWAMSHTTGTLHAVVITDNEYPAGVVQARAMKAEFGKYCSKCSIKYQNVSTVDWSTKIQPIAQTAITSDPKLTYILPIYDAMTQFVVAAINATQSSGRIRIATFNGTPAVLDMIRTGKIVQMDVGESPGWIGYAIVDEDLRLASGMAPVAKELVGVRIFTKSNVAQAGAPAKLTQGYGKSFVTGYRKLWGVR